MRRPDDHLPSRGIRRRDGKKCRAERQEACQNPGDVVLPLVAAIGEQEHRNRAQTADKNVAHNGIIITAYRTLNPGTIEDNLSERQNEREGHSDNAYGFSEIEI